MAARIFTRAEMEDHICTTLGPYLKPTLSFDFLFDGRYSTGPEDMWKWLLKSSRSDRMKQTPGWSDCDDRGWVCVGDIKYRIHQKERKIQSRWGLIVAPAVLYTVSGHVRPLVFLDTGAPRFIEPMWNSLRKPEDLNWSYKIHGLFG